MSTVLLKGVGGTETLSGAPIWLPETKTQLVPSGQGTQPQESIRHVLMNGSPGLNSVPSLTVTSPSKHAFGGQRVGVGVVGVGVGVGVVGVGVGVGVGVVGVGVGLVGVGVGGIGVGVGLVGVGVGGIGVGVAVDVAVGVSVMVGVVVAWR